MREREGPLQGAVVPQSPGPPSPGLVLVPLGCWTSLLLPLSLSFSPEAQAERSFHVFYELLAGLDPREREQLSLQGPETYCYLNQVGEGPLGAGPQGLPGEGSPRRV